MSWNTLEKLEEYVTYTSEQDRLARTTFTFLLETTKEHRMCAFWEGIVHQAVKNTYS
jgi:hypothetical protein